MVALDLSRAFDTVNIGILMKIILETTLPPAIKRWFGNYLSGRQTYMTFRNINSKYRRVKQGVPQGGVLSPTLFNLYMFRLPLPPEGIKLVTYADDCTVLSSSTNIDEICSKLNNFIFTTWTKEVKTQLDLVIGNQHIPTVTCPKILGVTFDKMLTTCTGKQSSFQSKSLLPTLW